MTEATFEFRTGKRRESWFNAMTNGGEVYVELNETLDRIAVYFKYSPQDVEAMKSIKGRRWEPEGRFWHLPMEMSKARALREHFGSRMKLGPAVRAWAKEQVKLERNLRSLNAAFDAKLFKTPEVIRDVIAGRPFEHPTVPADHPLRRERPERPYQRADIRMMALSNAINGNDVGTGKTIEVIAAIFEAELNPEPILVIAPRRTLVNIWETEFNRFAPEYKVWASEQPSQRQAYMNHVACDLDDASGNVVCLIADDIRVEKSYDIKDQEILAGTPAVMKQDPLFACKDYKGNWYNFRSEAQRDFFRVDWGAVIIDEFHNVGLPNRNSLFSIAVKMLKAERRWPMSGTPIGGKARRLWPLLNYIDPKQYSSEWAWIDEWLEVTEEKVYIKGGRGRTRTVRNVSNNIREDRQQEFWEHHRMHLIRRTKKDALPGIPDAIELIIPTPMSGKQLAEYNQFDDEHEIILGKKRLSGAIVLSQYTRLRQMANTRLTYYSNDVKAKPEATADSCKLDYLLDSLDECGIKKTDFEPGARAYIGVLDKSFLTIVCDFLRRHGIDYDRLDGGTKDSRPLIDKFAGPQERPYVMAMTIQTGGTGLNLERAGSAHMLDEPWDPDVNTQFFGRGDRGARETPLKCYIYRTPDSIQEYVAQVASDKVLTNNTILGSVGDIEALRRAKG